MRSVRNAVYLVWFVLAALVTFGCQSDPVSRYETKNKQEDVLRDYGGERIDRRPTRSMP